ncbi:MAG: hypothetical protein ABSH30_03805 [Acidimicrobiales bacterium]|jgi:hypothetical protein
MTDATIPQHKHGELKRVFEYSIHPRTRAHAEGAVPPPPKVSDELDRSNGAARFNAWLAVKITNLVGSMWCAYAFTVLALAGLPMALRPGGEGLISWIAQTFLQLVLLSVIIVGQNVQAAASDHRAENTYEDAEAILHEAGQIQSHLEAQDKVLSDLIAQMLQVVRAEHPGPIAPAGGAAT